MYEKNGFIEKGERLRNPRSIKVLLRPEVYEWLVELSEDLDCTREVLIRGIIEDAYDHISSDQEDPQ